MAPALPPPLPDGPPHRRTIALRWEDIDLGVSRIKVRRRTYKGTVDVRKSRYAFATCRSHRAGPGAWAPPGGLRAAGRRGPVFPSTTGTPANGEALLTRMLKPAVRRAGVPWAGFHTLRKTCPSMLFRSGWNAKQVQVVVGHHSPAFTLATYVHLIPDDLPEPRFPELVAGPVTPPADEAGADHQECVTTRHPAGVQASP